MEPRPCAWVLKCTNSWDINSWILPKLKFQRVSPNTWLLSASQSPREVSSATDQRKRQEWIQAWGGTCAGSSGSSTAWHRGSLGTGPAQRHWGRDSREVAPMERQGPQSVLGRILTFHNDARPHLTCSTLLAETFSPREDHANCF